MNAFKALYANHHSWLNHWLRMKMGNQSDAADLAQDTFLRVLLSGDVDKLHEPRAFLTTVASGLVSNFYRRKKLEQAYIDALLHLPEAEVPSPEAKAIMLETLVEIDGLLDGLPYKVRKAFLLSQLDGMSQADIAGELGVSISTVKRYIVQAVEQCCFGGA
ncbi:sigma-70 family RNA polymerase sigma factor [Methylobacillus flagellatus]|uniref:sigma-70 family RNA polymerase sigma factor n=1 Tax=Methylobacillus flagellatus TaxID=405 RepID=UPI002868DC97|nr:sigma-70 family RNA polymerase sigma factor [Methylobacillus flagellatus]